ncbi:neugrin isoform X1 [Pangasianodon hypophthalmus]|uniref:neugrin isoform X1 n=2 Tax=Pangasianodon hypophthalmus TaxID=310915 RepID=UPI002307063A|nr:neugrin isoform X1 [Pangasianodon hypophthalmus]
MLEVFVHVLLSILCARLCLGLSMFSVLRLAGSVAGKLASLAPLPALTCRHASRSARAWTGSATRTHSLSGNRRTEQHDISEDDLDMDEVESKLEALVKEERKREKSAKFHKIRRKLSSRGAPERRLSWDAIQQIRYLKQESPEEWTLQKLAEGFSVSTDVIYRVLHSKFTPPPERRFKQDAKVLTTVGQLSLEDGKTNQSRKGQSQLPLPTSDVPALISSGNTSTVIALTSGALTPAECTTGLVPSAANVPSPSIRTAQISTVAQGTLQEQPALRQEATDVKERVVEVEEEEEEWDGVVFTDEGLEELIHTLQEKPSPVEQKGREFYDGDGNFLYRI